MGIAYAGPNNYKLNRTRDYTPTFVPNGGYGAEFQKQSGGAEKFYHFMDKELIPYVKKHFKVNNNRTLIGHSFAGLYASYLLVNHSELFNNYVIVSPSLWYDNKYLIKLISKKSNYHLSQKTKAYLVIGSQENKGDYRMINDLVLFKNIILSKKSSNLLINMSVINDLDHDTIFPMGLTKGLMSALRINTKNKD